MATNTLFEKLLQSSFEVNEVRFITPKKAYPLLMEDALLIDLRPLSESTFKQAKVMRMMLLPYTEFEDHKATIPQDRPVVFMDAAGIQVKKFCPQLSEEGYKQVFAIAGGIVEWERDGMPMEEDVSQRLTGSCVCQLKPRER